MKCNVGSTEKIIRILAAGVGAYLGFTVSPWFYLITVIGLITAIVGYCPVNHLLGINTCKVEGEKNSNTS